MASVGADDPTPLLPGGGSKQMLEKQCLLLLELGQIVQELKMGSKRSDKPQLGCALQQRSEVQSPSSLTVALELGTLAQSKRQVEEAPCSSPQGAQYSKGKRQASSRPQVCSTLAVRFLLSPLALCGRSAG